MGGANLVKPHPPNNIKRLMKKNRTAGASQKVGRRAHEGFRTGIIERLTDMFSRKQTISVIFWTVCGSMRLTDHLMLRFSTRVRIHKHILELFYHKDLRSRLIYRKNGIDRNAKTERKRTETLNYESWFSLQTLNGTDEDFVISQA